MKKNIIAIMLLTALTLAVGGCSKDSDDAPGPDQPSGQSADLTPGTDVRPTATWVAPSQELYELWMSVQVQLGDTLTEYQSSADMMCATINDEVRAVTTPMSTGGVVYYPLSIGGNGDEKMVSLRYYCDRLHRIYTITNWTAFNIAVPPIGESGIYRPRFAQP